MAAQGTRESAPALSRQQEGTFSQRLVGLMDDVLEGKAPNAGLFCGYCYHPVPAASPPAQGHCHHCGRSHADWPAVTRVPDEVFSMYRAQRSREGWMVRGIAWSGLTLGVVLGLLPLAFSGVAWWTVLAFFGTMALFYVGSANLANSLGDAIGYRWGQSAVRRRWQTFIASREENGAL